jgi:hypothetical protein
MENNFYSHSPHIAKHAIPQGFHEKIFLKLDCGFTSIFQSKTRPAIAVFSYSLEKQAHCAVRASSQKIYIGAKVHQALCA